MKNHIIKTLNESQSLLSSFINSETNIINIEKATALFINCLENGNSIYSCGNGGSMSDSMHFAEELTGRFRNDRKGLSATSISDPSHITCVANDYGFDFIFSRYLEAKAKKGDCLLAISTSGNSKNILKAIEYAVENDITVITLTGKEKSRASKNANVDVFTVDSQYSDRIQELHIKIIHIFIEMIERKFFPNNYL